MKIISSVIVASAILTTTVSAKQGDWYVGLQSSWPAYGISAKYDLSSKLTVQGIVGGYGYGNSFTARGLYKFKQRAGWNAYGFGQVGLLTWSGHYYHNDYSTSSLMAGAGAGVEWDWRHYLGRDFLPLFSSIEIGYSMDFGGYDYYNYSGVYVGGGLHYKF